MMHPIQATCFNVSGAHCLPDILIQNKVLLSNGCKAGSQYRADYSNTCASHEVTLVQIIMILATGSCVCVIAVNLFSLVMVCGFKQFLFE